MVPDLLSFMQRLEVLAFFAGYPLLYALVYLVVKIPSFHRAAVIQSLLPAAYALTASFFLLRQVFFAHEPSSLYILALKVWGSLGILFWLSALRTPIILSFFHSFIFFGLIILDILTGLPTASGRDQVTNDMKILTDSLLLNSASFIVTIGVAFVQSLVSRTFHR